MSDREQAMERVMRTAAEDGRLLAVFLFGSLARAEAAAASDVDLCLVLDATHTDADTVGSVKLDYLEGTPDSFDIQVYQSLPLYVRKRVLAAGKVLYCRDDDALYELARQTIREFEDFRPRYQYYLDEVARAGS
jgi:uncharacterized protein